MKPDSLFLENERLFNSVEVELVRRWAFGQVPEMFGNYEASVLKSFVKAWWNLYHEATCAYNLTSRTVWHRSQELSASSLDTSELVSALLRIRQLILLEAIEEFRAIKKYEESAVGGLTILLEYYRHFDEPRAKQTA